MCQKFILRKQRKHSSSKKTVRPSALSLLGEPAEAVEGTSPDLHPWLLLTNAVETVQRHIYRLMQLIAL